MTNSNVIVDDSEGVELRELIDDPSGSKLTFYIDEHGDIAIQYKNQEIRWVDQHLIQAIGQATFEEGLP